MIRPIMRDPIFLVQKSAPAMAEDLTLARDLLETLEASKDRCVGMAANMIGVSRRVIAFDNGGTYMAMFNPEIVKSSGPYGAEEACLSLDHPLPLHQGAVSERAVPGPVQDLHGLASPDHPA